MDILPLSLFGDTSLPQLPRVFPASTGKRLTAATLATHSLVNSATFTALNTEFRHLTSSTARLTAAGHLIMKTCDHLLVRKFTHTLQHGEGCENACIICSKSLVSHLFVDIAQKGKQFMKAYFLLYQMVYVSSNSNKNPVIIFYLKLVVSRKLSMANSQKTSFCVPFCRHCPVFPLLMKKRQVVDQKGKQI